MEKGYLDASKEDSFKKRLFDDVYVNEVLDLLDGCNMNQEKENLLEVLSKIDGMYELIQTQEKSIHNLENEIQKLNEPKAKRLLNEIINDAKEDYNALKVEFINLKEAVIDRCKFLMETFKASGQHAFYKAFEETSKALKDVFSNLKNRHINCIKMLDKRIERVISIRNEINMAKGHLKNIGRLIMGKKAQSIKESKSTPFILSSAQNHFEKNKRINENLISIDEYCINKLDLLEKSFGEKSRNRKKNLDDRISKASKSRKSHEKTNEYVLEQGR